MNKLYKSNKEKVFDGVCGGIGEYFAIDPVVVRLLWVVLVIFGGTGVLAYLVAMLIIPKNPESAPVDARNDKQKEPEAFSQRFWGVLLVIVGLLLLVGLIGPIGGLFAGVALFMGSVLWPILVIALGLYLFFNKSDKDDLKSSIDAVFPSGKKLFRSRADRQVSGVCGGIGAYLDVDSNIIRIFWVMATLGSFGFGVLAYLALAVFLSEMD